MAHQRHMSNLQEAQIRLAVVSHTPGAAASVSLLSLFLLRKVTSLTVVAGGMWSDTSLPKIYSYTMHCSFPQLCLNYKVSTMLGECWSPWRNPGLQFLVKNRWSSGKAMHIGLMVYFPKGKSCCNTFFSPPIFIVFYCSRFLLLIANKVFNILR